MQNLFFSAYYNILKYFNKNLKQNRYNVIFFYILLFFQFKNDSKYTIKINDKLSFKGNLKNNRYRYLYFERTHEPVETKILQQIIKEDSVIFDIGANIGWYSLSLASIATKGMVYAFEPVDIVAKELSSNIEFNNFENIRVEKFALAEKEEDILIYFDDKNWGTTSLKTNKKIGKTEQSIKVKTFDKWVEFNQIKRIDLIKCDVEGAELSFLKGALKTFESFKPNLMIEIGKVSMNKFNTKPAEVIDFLMKLGYTIYNIDKNARSLNNSLIKVEYLDESFLQSNFLAIHSSKQDIINNIV